MRDIQWLCNLCAVCWCKCEAMNYEGPKTSFMTKCRSRVLPAANF